ncbi:MAG TPA: COX aromatic rich motif-containing protein [Dokdonella sp.]|uniref:COX aromatic rich motif-containing protein n=1 Tax=Dokdonella sp. TaxID=2291710 RepID=UPI002D7F3F68|nr:COX aromatic rich motif-containing protein [Dokdonella sp.]HET9032895.1 COX aromatic rich motif-containing protein [Dokdonella sp.]
MLAPGGPTAAAELSLFWLVIALTLIVVVPVLLLTPWLAWRYRHGAKSSDYRPDWEYSRPMEYLIWGVPIAVTAILAGVLWPQAFQLDPYQPLPSASAPLEVEVVSLDWKWLFIYPEQHLAAVNQLAIPVGRPVHLTLTSDSVMQSLMIPQLAGQIYTMAGMKTQLYLQADQVGTYRGENTQFNGKGFPQQKFKTLALSARDFAGWIDKVRQSGQALDCSTYADLQKRSVLDEPRFYGTASQHLFDWIASKYHSHPTLSCSSIQTGSHHG